MKVNEEEGPWIYSNFGSPDIWSIISYKLLRGLVNDRFWLQAEIGGFKGLQHKLDQWKQREKNMVQFDLCYKLVYLSPQLWIFLLAKQNNVKFNKMNF